MALLVPDAIAGCVKFVAVTVSAPAVLNVILNDAEPPASGALDGSTAFASLDVIATLSFVVMRFQLASTAFTDTLNDDPAVCAFGVPALPVALPGTADSPGAKTCNLVKAPAFTTVGGLVLGVLVPSSMSN